MTSQRSNLGTVVAAVLAVAAVAAGISSATVLATVPSAVVAGLVFGLAVGNRLAGLPERLGRTRGRRLLPYVPALGLAAVLPVTTVTPLVSSTRLAVVTLAFVVLVGAAGVGVAQMSRSRYIAAVTDEPIVAWTWHRTAFDDGLWGTFALGGGVLLFVWGLASITFDSRSGVWFAGYGGVILLLWVGDRLGWETWSWTAHDVENRWGGIDLEAHEIGVVVDRFERKLLPWDRIADVRLTDDALVLERRGWFDIRCDQDAIDDPEAVYETVVETRSRARSFEGSE
ncbi:hypothetical protein [Halobiforma nitratireducens]|uniref:Uncharacterized protein n=1 Tax=Halobiforma nitratireducens JCM 10879 TaxID=1227454 RepID=M0LXC4_9EURY|nr:hypothetical protein [Halobiforma nitratireducens]EMA38237.1 hypothetical protein C446_10105 [Halobiforma nitratireducens JCM 10879]